MRAIVVGGGIGGLTDIEIALQLYEERRADRTAHIVRQLRQMGPVVGYEV